MMRRHIERALDALFTGEVAAWIYPALRIGLALILLVRQSDVLSPWVFLQHHLWVQGLDFWWSVEASPPLVSPLIAAFELSENTNNGLVLARTLLAVLLLFGIQSQRCALLLAVTSYALMLADRHRYFHHLHLLYVSIAWLSLCPLDCRFSLERAVRRWLRRGTQPPVRTAPIWPLQLLRACLLSVYLGAGVSKLDPGWLRGDTLAVLGEAYIMRGAAWAFLRGWFEPPVLAWMTLATEWLLPVALVVPLTRRFGVAAGLAFHTVIGLSVMVSTFGVQMAILLLTFLPRRVHGSGPPSCVPSRSSPDCAS
jgi:hypothetical protein